MIQTIIFLLFLPALYSFLFPYTSLKCDIQDEPDELIKYYAGREGNSTSLCFLEAKQSDGIKMILFVDGGDRSAYQRIRAQFMPEPPDLPTSIETSSEAIHSTNPEHDHASTMMISLALILPITYFIS